jgi:hypothetical protein
MKMDDNQLASCIIIYTSGITALLPLLRDFVKKKSRGKKSSKELRFFEA